MDKAHITICTIVYDGACLDTATLEALSAQEIPLHVSFEILVIDTTGSPSLPRVLDAYNWGYGVAIRYMFLPLKNISMLRNAAIKRYKSDFSAFIENGFIPESSWLKELYRVMVGASAQVVLGRTITVSPGGIVQDDYNTRVFYTADNCLLATSFFADCRYPFDLLFAARGEGDVLCFVKMKRDGVCFKIAPQAIAREYLEREPDMRWIAVRAFKDGGLYCFTRKEGKNFFLKLCILFYASLYLFVCIMVSPVVLMVLSVRKSWCHVFVRKVFFLCGVMGVFF